MRFLPALTASRLGLHSKSGRGEPVHAGSFIRSREVVLDAALRSDARELSRIFVHEMFHFAWVRLGNPKRRSYEELLRGELAGGARGELGWSAEAVKKRLREASDGPLWRAYACESFCDTAAFLYSRCRRHEEFTLASKWRRKRARWFSESLGRRALSI